MKIERIWAMPNAWTFQIRPIKKLLDEEMERLEIDKNVWIDPFAGKYSPVPYKFKNDRHPDMETKYHLDALEFLRDRKLGDNFADGILLDPPYSITQAKKHYDDIGMDKLNIKPTSMKYWAEIKNEMARIIKPGGKAICFGWNSMGLGKNRGFRMERILLVPHGGSKNDTIVTVEIKI
jgi:hypothetical protein